MNLDGTSAVGLIDSMNTESVFITAESAAEQTIYPLKDIYYIYNSFGKLYYISPNYKDRLNLIEETFYNISFTIIICIVSLIIILLMNLCFLGHNILIYPFRVLNIDLITRFIFGTITYFLNI